MLSLEVNFSKTYFDMYNSQVPNYDVEDDFIVTFDIYQNNNLINHFEISRGEIDEFINFFDISNKDNELYIDYHYKHGRLTVSLQNNIFTTYLHIDYYITGHTTNTYHLTDDENEQFTAEFSKLFINYK